MKVEKFAAGEVALSVILLCDGYLLREVGSMGELLAFLDELQEAHPAARILTTLDNPSQAGYTSGHAIDYHELDCGDGGETPESLLQRLSTLQRLAADVRFPDLHGRLRLRKYDYKEEDGGEEEVRFQVEYGRPGLLLLNLYPKNLIERKVYVQMVPVTRACDALAALPNGYFEGHLTPMEAYRLCEHLEDQHGYGLFGIGAACVGFRRKLETPLDVEACARDVLSIYKEEGRPDPAHLEAVLTSSRELFLHYTD